MYIGQEQQRRREFHCRTNLKWSQGSIQRIFLAKKFLNKSYKNLPIIQIEYGSNIQKLSTSQSTQRYGGTKIVIGNLRNTKPQSELKIGRASRVPSEKPNTLSLTRKFRRFQIKTLVSRNLWTRWRNTNF